MAVPLPRNNRQQRAVKASQHFGMKIVDLQGGGVEEVTIDETEDEYISKLVSDTLATIRQLPEEAGQIKIASADKAIYDGVCAELTTEERKRVHFTFFDIPEPDDSRQV
jgi:hypothetical protein